MGEAGKRVGGGDFFYRGGGGDRVGQNRQIIIFLKRRGELSLEWGGKHLYVLLSWAWV